MFKATSPTAFFKALDLRYSAQGSPCEPLKGMNFFFVMGLLMVTWQVLLILAICGIFESRDQGWLRWFFLPWSACLKKEGI